MFQWIVSGIANGIPLFSGMFQMVVTFPVNIFTGIVQWIFSGISQWKFTLWFPVCNTCPWEFAIAFASFPAAPVSRRGRPRPGGHAHPEPRLTSTLIISYHIISYHIISYHIILYHIISYHIILYYIPFYSILFYSILFYYIILYYIMLYPIILYCYAILYHTMLYCVMLCYVMLCYYINLLTSMCNISGNLYVCVN